MTMHKIDQKKELLDRWTVRSISIRSCSQQIFLAAIITKTRGQVIASSFLKV
jgi:hypothetical protein